MVQFLDGSQNTGSRILQDNYKVWWRKTEMLDDSCTFDK